MGFSHRCTLIYNLKRTGTEVKKKEESWDSLIVSLIDKVFEFADGEDRGPDFTIGHLMDFQYAVSNTVPSVLKVSLLESGIIVINDYRASMRNFIKRWNKAASTT